jgi:16S rRNA processing protein RimM
VADAQRVAVGRVGRPHGLAGAFVVDDASDDPERFVLGAELWVDGDRNRIVESKRARGRPVIRLERKPPRGARLEVPRTALPPPGEGEFYVVDLLGLEVFADDGRPLGRVADVAPGVANDVLELDSGVALPMVEDCVREIDTSAGRIVVGASYASPQ